MVGELDRALDNVRDLVVAFAELPTTAPMHVKRHLLGHDPHGGTRVRFSVMPHRMARLLDVRTDPVARRTTAVDHFVAAGYEVHLNLSPVVVHEGWLAEWDELLTELGDVLSPTADLMARRTPWLTVRYAF